MEIQHFLFGEVDSVLGPLHRHERPSWFVLNYTQKAKRKFTVLCLTKWIPVWIRFIGASGPSCNDVTRPAQAQKFEKAGTAPSLSSLIQICFRIFMFTAGSPPPRTGRKLRESWPGPIFVMFDTNLLSDFHFHGQLAPRPGRARKCQKTARPHLRHF